MNTEIIQYCLVALLSLDAEQQTNEVQTLLNAPLVETQLAACMRAQGVDAETALSQWVQTVISESENIEDSLVDNDAGEIRAMGDTASTAPVIGVGDQPSW